MLAEWKTAKGVRRLNDINGLNAELWPYGKVGIEEDDAPLGSGMDAPEMLPGGSTYSAGHFRPFSSFAFRAGAFGGKEIKESERKLFEADAEPLGFDLARAESMTGELWAEYADDATGHRWAGWCAGRGVE